MLQYNRWVLYFLPFSHKLSWEASRSRLGRCLAKWIKNYLGKSKATNLCALITLVMFPFPLPKPTFPCAPCTLQWEVTSACMLRLQNSADEGKSLSTGKQPNQELVNDTEYGQKIMQHIEVSHEKQACAFLAAAMSVIFRLKSSTWGSGVCII